VENYKMVRSKRVAVANERWSFSNGHYQRLFTWREEDPSTTKILKNADPFQHFVFFVCIQSTCKLYLSLELGSS